MAKKQEGDAAGTDQAGANAPTSEGDPAAAPVGNVNSADQVGRPNGGAVATAAGEPTAWIRPVQSIPHGYQTLAAGRAVELPVEAARYYVGVRWAVPADGPDPEADAPAAAEAPQS